MKISIIVAMGHDRVIGKDNKLPRNYPEDLQFFRKTTTWKTIVMWRKTFESIWRPLPNRRNIILSRSVVENIECYDSIENLLKKLEAETSLAINDEIFIIWWENIYKQFLDLNLVYYIYLTEIKKKYDGDRYFPEFESKFIEMERVRWEELDFVKYGKK